MSSISRRQFLGLSAIAALGAGSAFGLSFTTEDIEYRHISISLSGLPKSFENYRIGFLTDVHLGSALPLDMARDAISFFERESVDLVVFGGDYIWTRSSEVAKLFPIIREKKYADIPPKFLPNIIFNDFADIARSIKPGDGFLAIMGNHDGWTAPAECRSALGAKGIKLLENESTVIRRGDERLIFYGCEDYWTGIPAAPTNIDPKLDKESLIFLCHNPDFLGWCLARPLKYSLALAGHTHGGQIRLPLIGAPFYNIEDRRFTDGLIEIGDKKIFVSRGLGVVEVPYRINCRPEAVVISLRRA